MKDKALQADSQEEKSKTSAATDESAAKMTVKTEVKEENIEKCKREPHEDEDCTEEKKLNCVLEDLEKLNIAPDSNTDKQNISTDVKDEDFVQRGPTFGVPSTQARLMQDKTLPIGPTGNYAAPQMHFQQYQLKGNRRLIEEPEDQPQKYFRPPPTQFEQANIPQCVQQQPNFQQSYGNFQGTNDLSRGLCQSVINPPMFNFATEQNFQFGQQVTTTDVRNTNNMSGGKVTVQSPVTGGPNPFPAVNIADDFLDEMAEQQQRMSVVSQGNMLNFTNGQLGTNSNWETNNFETDFTKDSFKEMRRRSDPDSGIESEGGSPWSEQAPSPGSVYTSPPSVESGIGRSPIHENQYSYGVSPPKYPGVTSPASYRATPSPANTSGYGSPGQPQLEDNDTINEALLEDAMEVIKADLQSTEESKKQKQQLVASQQQISAMIPQVIPASVSMTQPAMLNQQLAPGVLRQPVMIPPGQQMQPTNVTTAGIIPVTTSGAPQQIIILPPPQQPNPNHPVILVPVQTSPAPQKKKSQYKPILPKISQPPNSSGTSGTSMASAGSMAHTSVTMSNKGSSVSNRNQQNPQVQDRLNKLLMIARRTVADIPRADLSKQDEEGDTYLHIAVCKTDKYMVQALLERLHRENLHHLVDQENMKRQTPLYLAVFIKEPLMVAMLIKFQANVNVLAQNLSSDGVTMEVKAAIHVAASQGADYHRTLVELLKAKDMQINIVNNYGQTALHCAIFAHEKPKRNGQGRIDSVEIIKTLIKNGADPSAQDKKSGKTPLMYAIEQRSTVLVDTILGAVEPDKVKNVVKTQAFDGSSCLKIAEGLKGSFEVEIWNRLWNSLQSAANGTMSRFHYANQFAV